MNFQPVRPDLVRYQVRGTEGTPPWAQETKKPGAFGRFLSGVGRVLGAVSAPLSFVFPPAALAAAGMYGSAQVGDIVQARAYERAVEQQSAQQANYVVYPGLDMGGPLQGAQASQGIQAPQGMQAPQGPAGYSYSARDEDVMNVLFARDNALHSMAESL